MRLEKLGSQSRATLGDNAPKAETTHSNDDLREVNSLDPVENEHVRLIDARPRSSCTMLGREDEHGVSLSAGVVGRRESMTIEVSARRHDRESGALGSHIALPPHRFGPHQHHVGQLPNHPENRAISA